MPVRSKGRKKAAPKKEEPKEIVKVEEPDEIVPPVEEDHELTVGLDEQEREEFARILKGKMTLEKRAELLVEIAQMTDTKRAPVALRAIQEINKITRVTEDKPSESNALFVLPPNTAVAVRTFEPEE